MAWGHNSHGLLANIWVQDPQISKTRWELLLYSDRSQSGSHVLHNSLMFLLACQALFAMTETNTVWYGKTQQGSYLCKQNRNRWDLRIWGEQSWYSMLVRMWIFSITLTLQERGRIFKRSDCAIEKYQVKRHRRCSTGPALVLTGSSTERMSANTWSYATPTRHSGFINTFHCYYSWGNWQFGSTWRSHQSRMIFTRISWTSFACEEQSLSLFSRLISIKLCFWLGTLCTERSEWNYFSYLSFFFPLSWIVLL